MPSINVALILALALLAIGLVLFVIIRKNKDK